MMWPRLRMLLAIGAALILPHVAHAQLLGCTAAATGLVFNYVPSAGTPSDSAGSVSVTCNLISVVGGSYTIGASTGYGTYGSRHMTSGVNSLTYQLYTDSGHTVVWGNGTAGTSLIAGSMSGFIGSATNTSTVYGRIPPVQWVSAGAYADTIIVTITY